ncbi:MAG: helix-turn-helix transcriptional regulator [Propionibacteriaceae bacterium]|jgi:putative transcriptional regulator|nr:helix-turn-helix transcriptional regulator [Propionibacteriaceae bacterium]
MGVVVNLDVVLALRKMRLVDLSDEVGITLANLSNLKTGKARAIRFTTLAAICEALDCQPGDLLEYVPEPDPPENGDGAPGRDSPSTSRSRTA